MTGVDKANMINGSLGHSGSRQAGRDVLAHGRRERMQVLAISNAQIQPSGSTLTA